VDVDQLALTTVYTVNDIGIRTEIRNPRGVPTMFAINPLDQVTQRTSGGPGFRTRYFYDRNGQVERQERDNLDDHGVASPDGDEVRTYRYDEQNNLLAAGTGGRDPGSRHVTRYRYDAADCRVAAILPLGNVERYDYEERQLLRATTRGASGPQPATTRVRYDGDGRKTVLTDGRGNDKVYRYDAFGRVVATTDVLGGVEQVQYDKSDNVLLRRFFERTTTGDHRLLSRLAFDYDERGNRIRQTDFLFRDGIDTLDIETAPDAEFLAAQAAGLVSAHVTQFFYDANKRVFRTVDPRGHETTWTYDGANRRVRSVDALGNVVNTAYDENSNILRVDRHEQVRDPATGAVLHEDVFSRIFEYDLLDRRIASIDGLGNRTSFTYDSRDNQVSVTDPLGNVRRSVFDIFNRRRLQVCTMTSTGQGGGAPLPDIDTEYLYDDNDRLSAVIDPGGNKTEFGYDDLDRPSWTRWADGTRSSLAYDPDDHVVLRVDNNGLGVVSRFDPLGRLLRLDIDTSGLAQPSSYPADADRFEAYTYDGLGRPLSRTNDFCAIGTRFDSLGRAVADTLRFTLPVAAPAGALLLGREFDELANRTGVTYPDGRSIHYEFDELNRIARITNQTVGGNYPGSTTFPPQYLIAEFRYRGLRRVTATYANQCTVDHAYDGAGRCIGELHSTGGAAFLELQQLFDGAGNRRFELESPAPPGLPGGRVYGFDSLARLTTSAPAALAPFGTAAFEPSDVPLPTTALTGQQLIDATIAQLTQGAASATSYEYDAAGNRLAEREPGQPPTLYTPNTLNEYADVGGTALAYDLNGNLVGDARFRYRYNYRNQLVGVLDVATGADVSRLWYDALGRLIAVEANGQPTVLINDGPHAVEEYTGAVLTSQYVNEEGVDRHCQVATGAEEWWCHRDILGSPRQLSDAQGQLFPEQFVYDPFGQPLGGWAATAPTPYLYTGKRHLGTAQLYHSRARQYSPALGRFLQRDPQGFGDGPNLYQYVGNNPVGWVDPLGTDRSSVASTDSAERELRAVASMIDPNGAQPDLLTAAVGASPGVLAAGAAGGAAVSGPAPAAEASPAQPGFLDWLGWEYGDKAYERGVTVHIRPGRYQDPQLTLRTGRWDASRKPEPGARSEVYGPYGADTYGLWLEESNWSAADLPQIIAAPKRSSPGIGRAPTRKPNAEFLRFGYDASIGLQGGFTLSNDRLQIGYGAGMGAAVAVSTRSRFLRIGLSEGPSLLGRLHSSDENANRVREWGFGVDAGPITLDYKSESILTDLPFLLTGMVLPLVFGEAVIDRLTWELSDEK
jgi:RHS repeat-associated protein